jgi:hypothetical protein
LHALQPAKGSGIPAGSRGILVSCFTGKETYAGREAIAIMSAALDTLAPAKTAADEAGAQDIASAIANEVAELKDVRKAPFTAINLGIGSLVYLQYNGEEGGPTPADLVLHICRQAKETGQNTTRLCTRFYPIEYTCPATLEHMGELAKQVADKYFPKQDAAEGVAVSGLFMLEGSHCVLFTQGSTSPSNQGR